MYTLLFIVCKWFWVVHRSRWNVCVLNGRPGEDRIKGNCCFSWQGPFVAAFASSNLGDVSPNILGPRCANTGESCDNANSTCPIGGVGTYARKSSLWHVMYLLCLKTHRSLTGRFSSSIPRPTYLYQLLCSKAPMKCQWDKIIIFYVIVKFFEWWGNLGNVRD